MDNNTLDTVKFLLRDIRKLTEQFTDIKNKFTDVKKSQDTLQIDLESLEERLIKLEENQPGTGVIAVGNYSVSKEDSETLLDLPLNRILQVYGELPQVLDPVCRRAAVILNYERDRPTLERNPPWQLLGFKIKKSGLFAVSQTRCFCTNCSSRKFTKSF